MQQVIDGFEISARDLTRARAGRLTGVHSVSINLPYRISLELLIQDRQIIRIHIGDHGAVY